MLSLRYDLTLPFARYLAMNKVTHIKRYHLGRVYRRGKTNLREFYQCDFDIAGNFGKMIPDAEVVKVLCELLSELDLPRFVVKINHSALQNGLKELCAASALQFSAISPVLQKHDRVPWSTIQSNLVSQNLVSAQIAAHLGRLFSSSHSPKQLLALLQKESGFSARGIQELQLLLDYIEVFGCLSSIVFDLSLVHDMKYSGVFYQAELLPNHECVAVGGRYDRLVGAMFSTSPPVGA